MEIPEDDVRAMFLGRVVQFDDGQHGRRTCFVNWCECSQEARGPDIEMQVSLQGVLLPSQFPGIQHIFARPDSPAAERPLLLSKEQRLFFYAGYALEAGFTHRYRLTFTAGSRKAHDHSAFASAPAPAPAPVPAHGPLFYNFLNGNSLCWMNAVLQILVHLPFVRDWIEGEPSVSSTELGKETVLLFGSMGVARADLGRAGENQKRMSSTWYRTFADTLAQRGMENPFTKISFNDVDEFFIKAILALAAGADERARERAETCLAVKMRKWTLCACNRNDQFPNASCIHAERMQRDRILPLQEFPLWRVTGHSSRNLSEALNSSLRVGGEPRMNCGDARNVPYTGGHLVEEWPSVLCISLSRFDPGYRYRPSEFELLPEFTFEDLRLVDPPPEADRLRHHTFAGKYVLHSLTVFRNSGAAHHFAWTHVEGGGEGHDGWYRFDDYTAEVFGAGPSTFAEMCAYQGGEVRHHACLLFYVRVDN